MKSVPNSPISNRKQRKTNKRPSLEDKVKVLQKAKEPASPENPFFSPNPHRSEHSISSHRKSISLNKSFDSSILIENEVNYYDSQIIPTDKLIRRHFSEDLIDSFKTLFALDSILKSKKNLDKIKPTSPPSSEQISKLVQYDTEVNNKKQSYKPLLVLDLDETLVHSEITNSPDRKSQGPALHSNLFTTDSASTASSIADFKKEKFISEAHECLSGEWTFTLDFQDSLLQVEVLFRPHLYEFLARVSKYFNIAVFTASQRIYADKVIDRLEKAIDIKARLYRENCSEFDGLYLKDLRILGKHKEVFLLDNSPVVTALQKKKGIYIESWYGEKDDCELLKIAKLLINACKDGTLGKLDRIVRVKEILNYLEKHFEEI